MPTVHVKQTEQLTIPVGGMTCAACQAHVQKALEREPAVESVSVSLMTREATVVFDGTATTPEKLVEIIRDTGYEADLPSAGSVIEQQEEQDRAQQREYAVLRRKAIVTVILGAVAMLLSMPLMSPGGHSSHASADPVLRWTMETIDPLFLRWMPWLYAFE